MRFHFIFFICFVLFSAFRANASDILPVSHRATYDLTLLKTKGGALSVVSAMGKMNYSIQKVCNTYKTETVFSLTIAYEISGIDTTLWRQVSTESDDGCLFDFTVSTLDDTGKEVTETKGKGICEGQKKKLTVLFPLSSEVTFPKTVYFPVQHIKTMLKAGKEGKKFVSSYVYDGSKLESLQKTHTVISPFVFETKNRSVSGDVALLSGNSKRFDTAFYNDLGLSAFNDGTPMYEVSMRLYDNGIAEDVRQDFGDFAIQSNLTHIERLPEIACP